MNNIINTITTTEIFTHLFNKMEESKKWVSECPSNEVRFGWWCQKEEDIIEEINRMTDYIDGRELTVDIYERIQLVSEISDVSKSVNGCRTRICWEDHSLDELQSTLDYYQSSLESELREENLRDESFIKGWNDEVGIYEGFGMNRSKGVREVVKNRGCSVPYRFSPMSFESLCWELSFPSEYREELKFDLYGF